MNQVNIYVKIHKIFFFRKFKIDFLIDDIFLDKSIVCILYCSTSPLYFFFFEFGHLAKQIII